MDFWKTLDFANRDLDCTADRIDWPVSAWPGQCFLVASRLAREWPALGRPVYGLWWGYISPKCAFAGRPFTHHGWIEAPDGSVVDPTRWVFLDAEPMIWHGVGEETEDYDPCGERFKAANVRPAPPWDPAERSFPTRRLSNGALPVVMTNIYPDLIMKGSAAELREKKLPEADRMLYKRVTLTQLCWLANLPVARFGGFTKEILGWIATAPHGRSFIPIDTRIQHLGA